MVKHKQIKQVFHCVKTKKLVCLDRYLAYFFGFFLFNFWLHR